MTEAIVLILAALMVVGVLIFSFRRVATVEERASLVLDDFVNSQHCLAATERALESLRASLPTTVAKARQDALEGSRRTIRGKVGEEMLPLLPGFPFQPADCKFMGAPIDYLVFEGMSEDNITGLVVLEVKTGSARASARQRQVRTCIEAGKVRFQQFNPEVSA